MAEMLIDGQRIPIPEGAYTGIELQQIAGADKGAMPVLRRGSKDIPVGPQERITIEPDDRVHFNTPMEAAHEVAGAITRAVKTFLTLPSSQKGIQMVIRESDYALLREHLLREDDKERVSFILFGAHESKGRIEEIYTHKVINLSDDDYARQGKMRVVPKLESQLAAFRAFADAEVVGLMHVHSHPFSKVADFSPLDNSIVKESVRSLKDYLMADDMEFPFLFGRMVVGQDDRGFSGYVHDKDGRQAGAIKRLKIVSEGKAVVIPCHLNRKEVAGNTSSHDTEVLDRNIKWLGEDGQALLSNTHLTICGVGGVGSLVALNARGLGLKKITLIDGDRIEKSNLNRLPGASLSDVGEYKVDVIKRMIHDVSPKTEVEVIREMTGSSNTTTKKALSEADIVIAGVDSFKARFDIQYLSARYLKPLIDIGSGIKLQEDTGKVTFMGGQVACYMPGGPCLCCQTVVQREIESDLSEDVKRTTGYVQDTNITPTSVVTINSIMAGHAVDSMIKHITGFSLPERYLRCNLLSNTYDSFNFSKNAGCLICGENGVEGKGDETEVTYIQR